MESIVCKERPHGGLLVNTIVGREATLRKIARAVNGRCLLPESQVPLWDWCGYDKFLCNKLVLRVSLAADGRGTFRAAAHVGNTMSIIEIGTEVKLPFAHLANIVGIYGVCHPGLPQSCRHTMSAIDKRAVLPHLLVEGALGLEITDIVVCSVGQANGVVVVNFPVPTEV